MSSSRLDIEEEKEGQDVIAYAALRNILCDFKVQEFDETETDILVTHTMTTLFQKLERAIQRNRMCKRLLQGPSGVGKSSTLIYIGHMARMKGYVVFPVQASEFVNQGSPMYVVIRKFLLTWIEAVGKETLKSIPARLYPTYASLYEIANQSGDERAIVNAFAQVVDELLMCITKPVVFLVDQCNAFHEDNQMLQMYAHSDLEVVGPMRNPVGKLFLDWNTFKVGNGGIFYGFSSAFQLMPTARDGNLALFTPLEPMDSSDFMVFVDFLLKEDRLPQDFDHDDLFELCGGIPREVREFVTAKEHLSARRNSNYSTWKQGYVKARIPYYKTRIQRLLSKEKLGAELWKQSVPFAASLFVGEKMSSAPDVWIASGLIVTRDRFQMLCCPAAEKAILSVFDDSRVTSQAIKIFLNDPTISWRSLELAVVYRFRSLHGRPICFYYTDLCGKNGRTFMVTAGLIEHGDTIAPEANSVRRNTLFFCRRNTPVVDCFIHDANGARILIQVSKSCYRDHCSKFNPDDPAVQGYARAAYEPDNTLALRYFYLTTDDKMMKTNERRSSRYYRSDVWLVAGEDLRKTLGDSVIMPLLDKDGEITNT